MVEAHSPDHAIAVEQEALQWRQVRLILVVACAGQHAKRHAGGPELRDTPVAATVRCFMPGVRVPHLPAFGIEQRIKTGHKHTWWDVSAAELVVQRTHYDAVRSGHQRYAAARAHWDHPALRYRLVEGDTEIVPGVTLQETSGHAPGLR
jgi:hypothetical protein